MCKAQSEGGQRCSGHTRDPYREAMSKVYEGRPVSKTEEQEVLRTATLFATTKTGRSEITEDIENYGNRRWIRSEILEQALVAGKRQREITRDVEKQLALAGKDARTAQSVIKYALQMRDAKEKGKTSVLKIYEDLSRKGKDGWEIYKATKAIILTERAAEIDAIREAVDHFYTASQLPRKVDTEDEKALKVISRLGLKVRVVLGVSDGTWSRPSDEHLEKLWENSPLSLRFHAMADASAELYLDSTHIKPDETII